ncbi:MAG: HAMP domain-containing protein [Tyzzerella sp.]|nr:HAMP domain-containing protein [Tyzzerella sp.]
MKKSIRRQIATIFIALVGAVLLISILINTWFLEGFYIHNKQSSLIQVYNQMNEAATEGTLTSEGMTIRLSELVEVGNISFVVVTDDNKALLTATQSERKTQELFTQLMGYLLNQNQTRGELLKSSRLYQIHSAKDVASQEEYIEMWGYLDNGNAFILRSPLESIRESVSLSNTFLIYIMVIMAVLGSVFVWFFTKRITNPILELTSLSARMANLDFDAKYVSGGENEIGVLGENFNTMSEKLEQTVSELKHANYELQKDIEKKEKLETMRTEFIGNVSHELKTPIALIQGYAEGLKEGITDDPESRAFYCDVIMDEANKMNQLVKNLLTLNQLEFGEEEVTFERFDVTELIRGIIQSNEILIQQKQVEVRFSCEESVCVWADEFKVEQVVRNYLSNALNHVSRERVIDIRVIVNDTNDKVRISVFNTGDKIPEEDIEHIWSKFYKVDKARTREYGGHGIGLSIVKAIMDSFQQDYGVVNYENGVAFWFELDFK